MSTAEEQGGAERRDYFRIADQAVLTWRLVDPEAVPALLAELSRASGDDFALTAQFEDVNRQLRGVLDRLRGEQPQVVRALQLFDRKLDLLAEQLMLDNMGADEQAVREISLSAGGLSFVAEQAVDPDRVLELKMVLLPSRQGVRLAARVVRSTPADGGYLLACEFLGLRESVRQILMRHTLDRQAAELRRQRLQA